MLKAPKVNNTTTEFQAIVDQVDRDGRAFADWAMKLAAGSPDVALAILGVAADRIIEGIDPERRTEVLQDYLDSFGGNPDA